MPLPADGQEVHDNEPFDALKGFNEAVSAKDVLYEDRIELLQEDTEELSRRLNILHNLTFNGRMASYILRALQRRKP